MAFDVIVVGSGMTGGWAAKELAEQGFKVLVLERGKRIEHATDYKDNLAPWEWDNRGRVPEPEVAEDYVVQSTCYAFSSQNKDFWVKDSEHPYSTPVGKEFRWVRGYHLGGRSLMWGRQSYRLSAMDFEANARDGHGVDWPIRYSDLAPWYDRVERFAGISGSREGMPQLPDGQFQPPMDLTAVEKDFQRKLARSHPGRKLFIGRTANLTEPTEEQVELGRGPCQSRNICAHGCSFGAYFSSLSATLPAAERTGNVTIVTDAIVESVIYDAASKRATGVRVIDANSKETRTYEAKVVFLCASAIASSNILLNSKSDAFPSGLANRSDQVGRNLMDHIGVSVVAMASGFDDRYYWGRRPNGAYMPRYRNVTEPGEGFVRGFGYQIQTMRAGWTMGARQPGVGAELKQRVRQPGPWIVVMSGFGEMLPNPDNRVTLHATRRDRWGIPICHIDCSYGENERKIMQCIEADANEMVTAAGYQKRPAPMYPSVPGDKIHEMGTARMGRDPATSVLNAHNHAHDIDNLYITDGACMASSACQNPSLTYMAITARAAHHAGDRLRAGTL
jgi:choline dehydrogenase-like flavoprotein